MTKPLAPTVHCNHTAINDDTGKEFCFQTAKKAKYRSTHVSLLSRLSSCQIPLLPKHYPSLFIYYYRHRQHARPKNHHVQSRGLIRHPTLPRAVPDSGAGAKKGKRRWPRDHQSCGLTNESRMANLTSSLSTHTSRSMTRGHKATTSSRTRFLLRLRM
jgi:hypothetical protein